MKTFVTKAGMAAALLAFQVGCGKPRFSIELPRPTEEAPMTTLEGTWKVMRVDLLEANQIEPRLGLEVGDLLLLSATGFISRNGASLEREELEREHQVILDWYLNMADPFVAQWGFSCYRYASDNQKMYHTLLSLERAAENALAGEQYISTRMSDADPQIWQRYSVFLERGPAAIPDVLPGAWEVASSEPVMATGPILRYRPPNGMAVFLGESGVEVLAGRPASRQFIETALGFPLDWYENTIEGWFVSFGMSYMQQDHPLMPDFQRTVLRGAAMDADTILARLSVEWRESLEGVLEEESYVLVLKRSGRE